jgi:hypothetical protein
LVVRAVPEALGDGCVTEVDGLPLTEGVLLLVLVDPDVLPAAELPLVPAEPLALPLADGAPDVLPAGPGAAVGALSPGVTVEPGGQS